MVEGTTLLGLGTTVVQLLKKGNCWNVGKYEWSSMLNLDLPICPAKSYADFDTRYVNRCHFGACDTASDVFPVEAWAVWVKDIKCTLSKVTYQCSWLAENLLCPPLETSAAVECCICLRSDKGSHFSHSGVCFKRMEDRTKITINTFIAFPLALQRDELQNLKKELEQTHIALFKV